MHLKLSEIIISSLVEVLDLKGESVSERLREAASYFEVKTICGEAGIKLEIDESLWEQTCYLDLERTRQILVNLLFNSFKFRRSSTSISANREKGDLVVSVSDDGEGLSHLAESHGIDMQTLAKPEDLPVLGHGIGLVGVQAILKQMKGRMSVESIADYGATFTITLPEVFHHSI